MLGSDSTSITTKQKKPFVLNKTLLTDFGFVLSTDEKLYEELACPFEDDISKAHPLCAKFPEGFLTFDFNFEKVNEKLTDQTLIYIFYNVMDERMQLFAAQSLMKKYMKYHKVEKVWVRMRENKFEYFNVHEWKYKIFEGNISENFASEADFAA